MSQGKRPGGLTALGIINFVFAFLGLLGLLGLVFMLVLLTTAVGDKPEMAEAKKAWEQIGIPLLILSLVMNVLSTVLLTLSGIGYLMLKRILGRYLGNIYAVVSIIGSIAGGIMTREVPGGGFNIMTMVGLIYPLLTLALVNTTFKEDLVT